MLRQTGQLHNGTGGRLAESSGSKSPIDHMAGLLKAVGSPSESQMRTFQWHRIREVRGFPA